MKKKYIFGLNKYLLHYISFQNLPLSMGIGISLWLRVTVNRFGKWTMGFFHSLLVLNILSKKGLSLQIFYGA